MERIPETELMDSAEQAEAYANADFAEPHNNFINDFVDRFPGFSNGKVLDLGCGTCDITIRFAETFPDSTILGIDGAQAMLSLGQDDVRKKGLSDRIHLQRTLLPDPRLTSKRYDAIISNSLLHHLKDPFVLWNSARDCSREAAPIFIMDLMRPETVEHAEELVSMHVSDESLLLQKDFINSLLAAYTVNEIRDQLKCASLQYLKVETVSDRHVIVWGNKC